MSRLRLRCVALTDIVLNERSATEGNQRTLDFIPGSNFLGIVASHLYREKNPEEALLLFHTGDVCFGDAHPSSGGVRGLRVPASMYYPKLGDLRDACYIYHAVPDWTDDALAALSLKQCREGFYRFPPSGGRARKVPTMRSFVIKSAYDKEHRRSKDERMYGYESLDKGCEFYFEVIFSERAECFRDEVRACLLGERRVGRSRTAEYGRVLIEEFDYAQESSCDDRPDEEDIVVYADGRLIFLDAYGLPTFRPSAADLGVPGGEVRWDKSRVRVFQYAPWNFKRQARDADRCGIEKGSVFVVRRPAGFRVDTERVACVGAYRAEGFGAVIYNPDFLRADAEGRTMIFAPGAPDADTAARVVATDVPAVDSPLLRSLRARKAREASLAETLERVNGFIDKHAALFAGDEAFASQWGTLQSIALRMGDSGALLDAIRAYIDHGVAHEKWQRRHRGEHLLRFLEESDAGHLHALVVNLAVEMRLITKKKDI